MKTRKRILSGLFVIVFCFIAVFGSVKAAEGAATEVQIEIEASEVPIVEEEGVEDVENGGIQTGDEKNPAVFVGIALLAIGAVAFLLRKKKKATVYMAALLIVFGTFLANVSANAADSSENVNVTIPSNVLILFEETGVNSMDKFTVSNESLVPITLDEVQVTEYNDWQLVEKESEIPVDTKNLVFELENQCLMAGNNVVSIEIPKNSEKELAVEITRGAWSYSKEAEAALKLEFEYEIGQAEFALSFNTNGSTESVSTMQVLNGMTVTLPVITRYGYALIGWQDSAGTVYTDSYTMPIGDTTLKAVWAETKAYAVYSDTDGSLTFCRAQTAIQAGSTYNGKTATAVYTGFEDTSYSSYTSVPWYSYRLKIKKIVAIDEITPSSVAYWFTGCKNCSYVDLGKVNTSKVTNMRQTFSLTGSEVTGDMKVLGLDKWDVSNVTNMQSMFNAVGENASTFYMDDITGWDVSSVVKMTNMFVYFAMKSGWTLDLRGWDVRNVTSYAGFNSSVESTVIAPLWVN